MKNSLPPFYVGQKVVCIESVPHNQFGFNRKGIDKNTILTVRRCYNNCVFFNEITNECDMGVFAVRDGGEPAYNVSKFSPVQDDFQSITLEKVLEEETKLISVN
jgi:hypothetical protein